MAQKTSVYDCDLNEVFLKDPSEPQLLPMTVVPSEILPQDFSTDEEWIRQCIKIRQCKRFVLAASPSFSVKSRTKKLCECGRTSEMHLENLAATETSDDKREEWSLEDDTCMVPTDAFGEVDFYDSSKKIAKFVRMDQSTDGVTIYKLLFNIWKLDKPALVISIVGGSNDLQTKPKVLQAVRRGLVKVARSGACFVTNGLRHGVMRVVGDAASASSSGIAKAVCLGVTPWSSVANRQVLLNANSAIPVAYSTRQRQSAELTGWSLEPSHSHFLLADNGTEKPNDADLILRDQLEEALVQSGVDYQESPISPTGRLHSSTSAASMRANVALQVPLCCLMIGGDKSSLETVLKSLVKNRPLVVVNASGRMADLLAFTLSRLQPLSNGLPTDQDEVECRFAEKTGEELLKLLQVETDNPEEMEELKNRIMSLVVQYNHLLHVFDVRSKSSGECSQNLDLSLLLAILRSRQNDDYECRVTNQLALAMQWDRFDIVQSELLTLDFRIRTATIRQLFSKAIAYNRPLFVRLLLDQGFSLREFLTADTLVDLYQNCIDSPFSLLLAKSPKTGMSIFSKRKRSPLKLADVGRAISSLCGGMHYSSYQHDPSICDVNYTAFLISEREHLKFQRQELRHKQQGDQEYRLTESSFGDPALHLFMYAVLANRKELAMVFWKELTQNLAAALTASFLLSKLLPYATDRDVNQEIGANADYFGQMAVGVLDACYSADQSLTHLHIVREQREFADVTCLDLADMAGNMPFIAHPACQTLLSVIWSGEIRDSNNFFSLLLCVLFPPFIPLFITFHRTVPPKLLTSLTSSATLRPDFSDVHNASFRVPPPIPAALTCRPLRRIVLFYISPRIKFLLDQVAYVLFLSLFTYMILGQFIDNCETRMSLFELVLVIWAFCLSAEEVRQLASEPGTKRHKLMEYISSPWNQLDVLAIACLLFAEALTVTRQLCFVSLPYIRVLTGISIFIFYSRLLQFFSANQLIGPKLVMIFRMLKDVMVVMTIIIVIVMGYTVVVVSMISAGQDFSFAVFSEGLSLVYWSMFGDSPVSTFSNITTYPIVQSVNGTLTTVAYADDPISAYYLVAFLGVFVILTNLLLFNVLIAMFNYTFSVIQEKADEYWCFQRYKLITEYYSRPPLPPPFLLLAHLWIALSYIIRHFRVYCRPSKDNVVVFAKHSSCKIKCDDSVNRQMISWEDLVVDEYLESVDRKEKQTMEKQMETVRENSKTMKDVLQYVASAVENSDLFNVKSKNLKSADQRLARLEESVGELNGTMQEVLRLLQKKTESKTG